MKTKTSFSLREFISSRWEETSTRDAFTKACETHQGKLLTKNFLKSLPSGHDWRIFRQYNMTHIQDLDYIMQRGSAGYSFLIAHQETNVLVPSPETLADLNAPYFRGTDERNALRKQILENPETCKQVSELLQRIRRAKRAFDKARAALAPFIAFRAPLAPDRYDLEKLLGFKLGDS